MEEFEFLLLPRDPEDRRQLLDSRKVPNAMSEPSNLPQKSFVRKLESVAQPFDPFRMD